jgi:hypothetical protein
LDASLMTHTGAGTGVRGHDRHNRPDDGQVLDEYVGMWRQCRIDVAAAIVRLPRLRLAVVPVGRTWIFLTAALWLILGNFAGKPHHATPTRRKRQQEGIGEDQQVYHELAHHHILGECRPNVQVRYDLSVNSRSLAPMSAARIRLSPTSTALTPAACKSSMSARL